MEQLEFDITYLNKNEEQYPINTKYETDIADKETKFIEAQMAVDQIVITQYLSHVKGRIRSDTIRRKSWSDLYKDRILHKEAQLTAYKDLQIEFKQMGLTK